MGPVKAEAVFDVQRHSSTFQGQESFELCAPSQCLDAETKGLLCLSVERAVLPAQRMGAQRDVPLTGEVSPVPPWASGLHRQPALTMFHPWPPSRAHIGPEQEPGQGKQPSIQEGPFPNWPGPGGRERRQEGNTGNHSLGCPRPSVIILQPPCLLPCFELPQSPMKLA